MKKIIKSLFTIELFVLIVSNASAATSKTFLLQRSYGMNLAMEYTTWNELLKMKKQNNFGADVQAVGFYQESASRDNIGKYFGIQNKSFFIGNTINDTDLAVNYLIHDGYSGLNGSFGNSAANVATFKINPKQTAYGVRVDYLQRLDNFLKGVYLKFAIPIVNVENNVRFRITGQDFTDNLITTNAATIESKFKDYFSGTFEWSNAGFTPITNQPTGANNLQIKQEKLKNGLFLGKKNSTGVADIDIALGYNFVEKERCFVGINASVILPISNDAEGDRVFEVIVGNDEHWGLGLAGVAAANLMGKGDNNLKLSVAFNYRYLFENTEKRTLGITGYDWGQYVLLGELNVIRGNQIFKPAANLLKQNVKVEPGSQFDGVANIAYNNGGFSIDLGYNFFWKDSENIERKDYWPDNKYGIIYASQEGGTNALDLFSYSAATVHTGTAGGAEAILNNEVDTANHVVAINSKAAETPSFTTHKIYAGLGYITKTVKNPLMIGVGGGYEFASKDAFENWQVWGKLGVAF